MKFINLIIFSFLCLTLNAQEVRINEVVSSNSEFFDEDGDTPDWFELHNYGTTAVSLKDWTITDDVNNLMKWTFPDITLQPDSYLMVWASKKDRAQISYARTLVDKGDTFKYLVPDSELTSDWTTVDFDDSQWLSGASGFGYADGDDATILPDGTKSVFVRIKFSVADTASITKLILDVDYDDAFVAYLNGKEVARANINGVPPTYNSGTITGHEANMYAGGIPERFIIDNLDILNSGVNVLCIQAHNISDTSSDLTLIPFLSAIYSTSTSDGSTPNPVLGLSDSNLHTNFKISKAETLTLTNNTGTTVDELYIVELPADVSMGTSILNGNLVYYNSPTPKAQNNSPESLGVITSNVVFSNVGGGVDDSFSLTLSGNGEGESIRYTIDATEPTETSLLYEGPIFIDRTSVIRACIFKTNFIPSSVSSKSFLFNTSHNLPVIYLVTNPYNLFDQQEGIYVLGDSYDPNAPYFGANFWEDWERPVQFSFYDKDGSLGVELNGGIKIFGGWSRANAQRSFSIFARDRYGKDVIDYPMFQDIPYDKFQSVVLRNSGNDWLNTMIRDAALTSLMQGSGLDYQGYRPTVTYVNGEYWGIYNLREKISEHFVASKHNVDPDSVDLLQLFGEVIEGDNQEYMELMEYVYTTDLSFDNNYAYVSNRIDIDNFIIYQLSQIYFNNTDWPGNNIKYWKEKGGKWRWILFDTDFGFGIWDVNDYRKNTLDFALEANGPDWPNPPWSTLLFRKLIENVSFRNKFVNRFADELNSRFLPTNVNAHLQAVFDVISSEIYSHFERWSAGYNSGNLQNMKTFGSNRPIYMKYFLKERFGFADTHRITIVNSDIRQGYVKLNSNLRIQTNSWTGEYFKEVPITLKAVPEIGYEFSHWSGVSSSTDAEIIISLEDASSSITPNFVLSTKDKAIVINEINYKSGSEVDANDWIELYNPNDYYLDISNWIFKDNDDTNIFIIPDGTSIEPDGYLVIARDSVDFSDAFPDVDNYIGVFSFGLSSSGDAVRVFDDNMILQDEVYFLPIAPWPVCANGQGPTLELVSPDFDNTLPVSWRCLSYYGSPGVMNNTTAVEELPDNVISVFPNPVNDYLYITGLKGSANVQVFDLSGKVLIEDTISNGIYLGSLKSGMYILKVVDNNTTVTLKIVKK